MNKSQLINQTSGEVEFYTPEFIIEAARLTMGSIDLDPASSKEANKRVKADRFYSMEDDGLARGWGWNVWLNHPFGRERNPLWIAKLMEEFHNGHIHQVCCITYACTSEKWFQPLLRYKQCFLCPRTNYILPNGKVYRGVPKGSVVTYLGPHDGIFVKYFSPFGVVK